MYRQQNKPSLYQTKAVCPKVLGKSAVLQSMSAAWDTSFFDYIIAHMFEKRRTNYTSAEQKKRIPLMTQVTSILR
jgi:hypothetical protein